MTWFFKTAAFCATGILLLALTLEVLGTTIEECHKECEHELDDPVCSRRNSTFGTETFYSFEWLRNECERKCYRGGEMYLREPNMELCYQRGKDRASYNCSLIKDPGQSLECFKKSREERKAMEAARHGNGTTNSTS